MEVAGIKVTWVTVLLVLASMAIGAYLNYLTTKAATAKENEKLFAQIKAEIEALKARSQTTRLTQGEENHLRGLEQTLSILESKLK